MAVKELSTAIQTPKSTVSIPAAANSLDVAFEAPSVAADGVQFSPAGNELILIRNASGGPSTFTVTSARDEYGRTGDITTYSIATGGLAYLPLKANKLFAGGTTPGKILITMSSTTIEVAVLKMPYSF